MNLYKIFFLLLFVQKYMREKKILTAKTNKKNKNSKEQRIRSCKRCEGERSNEAGMNV